MDKFLPSFLYNFLRRLHQAREQRKFDRLPPLSLGELRKFLTENLGLVSGDTLFIHANFSILKMNCQPEAVIDLLMDIVGPSGNLLMPFYPLKRSYDFLLEGKPFDLRQHRTSMGALAIALAKKPGALKSLHPTKSVVVIGKDRDFLIIDHDKSLLPYSSSSPYARAPGLPRCKIVGLGVDDYLASVHVAIDEDPSYPVQPYHPDPLVGLVIDYQGRLNRVMTYAHDHAVTSKEDVPKFLVETHCPTYREVMYKHRPFWIVEGKALVQHVRDEGKKGSTFFYPRSINGKQPARRNPAHSKP